MCNIHIHPILFKLWLTGKKERKEGRKMEITKIEGKNES